MKISIKHLIIATILVIGLLLRLNNLHEVTTFTADQEWLAFRAKEILKGDFVTLGPVTSIGKFSIGPWFIYLWAFFGIFTQNAPITGAYLSVFLGMLTIVGLFLFVKNFIDEKLSYLTLFLTSISSSLILWDQIPWAPSLFYLSQIILLSGAYLATKNKIGYLLIVTGLIMGFSSHFGIVLSLISILIYFVFVKPVKISLKIFLFSILITLVGLLPNILFDISHNFLNLRKILDVVKGDEIRYFVSFNKIINILSLHISSLVYPRNNITFDSLVIKSLLAISLANAISLLRDKKFKNLSLLLLITAIFPAMFFYFTQGKFSEYYLLMTVPSLILLFVLFLKNFIRNKIVLAAILIMSVYLNYRQLSNRYVPWNLLAKENVAREIIKIGGYDDYGISLTTSLGNNFGFKYIFDYFKIKGDLPPKKGETKIFSIIIPEGFDGMVGLKDFDGVGLRWQGF